MKIDFEGQRARRRYRVRMKLVLIQAAQVAVIGAATAEEAIEMATRGSILDRVLWESAPELVGFEVVETVLERS